MNFGKKSIEILETADEQLKKIFYEAIKDSPIDFSVVCGYRGEKEQNEAFKNGFSKLKFPKSKHNLNPSKAIDAVPYPKLWDSTNEDFKMLANHILNTAKILNIKIRWGGDWNMDGDTKNEKFIDKPHYELI